RYMLLLAFPLALGTTLLSERIIQLVYGADYISSAVALSLLIWTTLFVFIGLINAAALIASGQQRFLAKLSLGLLVINAILNFFLIPEYGFIGASFASMLAQGIGVVIGSYIIYKNTGSNPFKKIEGMIGATLLMGLFIYFFHINLALAIMISILIYILFIFLFKVVDSRDIERFKNTLKKNQ
ncbi:MAG: polysaccharide biosynthesis C-terminal domain-containing protein, partial [Nanoarchaeota archaeon]|nr:polysaccharide biosynthesis C-terminal domain-containing protein [Nanoarchaeota archaeon]